MFMWKWNIKLRFTSNWRKIVVENIWDCHWIGNGGTINRKTLRDISRNFFNSYNRFYAFPCIFNAVPVGFKVMIVVVSFALPQGFCSLYILYDIFLLFEDFLQLWTFLVSCFNRVESWRAGVIQQFVLNFSLYLLTFFNGACVSKMEIHFV